MRVMIATLLLAVSLCAQGASEVRSTSVALTHVTVIDVAGGPSKADATVVIAGDRISAVGPSSRVTIPQGAAVIDATGKFLIPGLWDMHVHWEMKDYLPLFIANGVLGVRMMWGTPAHHEWARQTADGELLGPRLSIASPIIDGPNPIWRGSVGVANAAQAREAVLRAKEGGADFIKVYSLLSREAYFAIAAEAHRQGLPFVGHVPESVNAGEASDAGQKSIEHLTGVLLASSHDEAAIRAEMRDALAAGAAEPSALRFRRLTVNVKAVQTHDPAKAAALFARFKQNHTWQVPTLTVLRAITHLDDTNFTNDPRLRYLPKRFRDYWDPKRDARVRMYTAEDWVQSRMVYAQYLKLAGQMKRAGVEFLAGSDVSNPYCFPGFSLHDELTLLVEAGFTPLDALQAATINPARYLGMLDSLGTVEPGKFADLVLLTANPLQNIDNTRTIDSVFVAGKSIGRAQIDAMLARVEAIANAPSRDAEEKNPGAERAH